MNNRDLSLYHTFIERERFSKLNAIELFKLFNRIDHLDIDRNSQTSNDQTLLEVQRNKLLF